MKSFKRIGTKVKEKNCNFTNCILAGWTGAIGRHKMVHGCDFWSLFDIATKNKNKPGSCYGVCWVDKCSGEYLLKCMDEFEK